MIIKSLDHLQLISKKIADKISKKDCIFLVGEIGVGKTAFTRSLINYFQKKEGVNLKAWFLESATEFLADRGQLKLSLEINEERGEAVKVEV